MTTLKTKISKRSTRKKPVVCDYEDKLMEMIKHTPGIPVPVRQYRFSKGRHWRADFAWPDQRILLEVEGGAFIGGRHVRGMGFTKDCVKYNAAAMLGWMVLRFTTLQIRNGLAIETIKAIFGLASALQISKADAAAALGRVLALCRAAGLDVFSSRGSNDNQPCLLLLINGLIAEIEGNTLQIELSAEMEAGKDGKEPHMVLYDLVPGNKAVVH